MQGVWPSQLEVFRGNGHAAWTLGLCVQVAPSTLSVYRASAGAGAALRAHVRDQAFGARRPHSQKGLEWTVMQRKTGTELPASSQDFSGLSQMSLKNITHTGVPCQPGGVGWGGRWEGGSKGRGYMHTYSWFILRSDRKPQNSVKATILQFFKKLLFPLYYFSSPVFLKCWKKKDYYSPHKVHRGRRL